MLACPDPHGKVYIGKPGKEHKDDLDFTLKRIGFDFLADPVEIERFREILQEGSSPGESTLNKLVEELSKELNKCLEVNEMRKHF
jgi:hypothetical protein